MCFKVFHLLAPSDQQKHLSFVLSQYVTSSLLPLHLCSYTWPLLMMDSGSLEMPSPFVSTYPNPVHICTFITQDSFGYKEWKHLKLA